MKGRQPKILILDIETAPLLVRCYGLWQQNISTGFIVKDWYMLSFACKWHDKKRIHYIDCRDTFENDYEIAKFAHKMISEADIIVGHNVKRFDIKKLNTRFLKHGLPPVGKRQTIDTLTIAKRYFAITSNKLDYIAKFLKVGSKVKSKKYSQAEMWDACCRGVKDAFIHNQKYNKGDIVVTEAVFNALKAWDESLNFQAYTLDDSCICGSGDFKKQGITYTKNGAFQRLQCLKPKCGKYFQSKVNLLSKDDKKKLKYK